MEQNVRKPVVAGSFYPGDSSTLRETVEYFIQNAEPGRVDGEILALISPHAGYIYSGLVAAHGYKLISGGNYETVVVISPSHIEYFGFSSIFNGQSYATPLGEILIDNDLAEEIASMDDNIRISGKGHVFSPLGRGEHALEVQLPFLQVALGNFKLVPVVMGDQNEGNIDALANALGKSLKGKKALIVASSDLSHFHNSKEAKQLDDVFISHVERMETDGLLRALAQKDTEACGGGPVIAAIKTAMLLGADGCRILEYSHSGKVSGDNNNVVGYLSAAVFRKSSSQGGEDESSNHEKRPAESANPRIGENLSKEDKVFLLRVARSSIESNFLEEVSAPKMPESSILEEKRGAFVTLKKNGRLRGCIGYIEPIKPLVKTIFEMARAAAFQDHRFPPVKSTEVDDLSIDISVLSPVKEIDKPETVEVGVHGLIITRGANRGLLLPQVPVEWGWNRVEFLDQTCLKAGLPKDTWKKPGTKIEVFTANVFSEEELGLR